jgi:hypothetical protein
LESWISTGRDKYLAINIQRSKVKGKGKTSKKDDNRLFPMTTGNIRYMWGNLLQQVGLNERDSTTNRLLRRFHTLRKFHKSRLIGIVDKEKLDILMGHTAYMDMYNKFSLDELGEDFIKGEERLTMTGEMTELSERKIEKLEKKMKYKDEIHLEDIQKMASEQNSQRQELKLLRDSNELAKIEFEKLWEYTLKLREIYSRMNGWNPIRNESDMDDFIEKEKEFLELEKSNGYVKKLLKKKKTDESTSQ